MLAPLLQGGELSGVAPSFCRRTIVPSHRRTFIPSYRRTVIPSHRS